MTQTSRSTQSRRLQIELRRPGLFFLYSTCPRFAVTVTKLFIPITFACAHLEIERTPRHENERYSLSLRR